MPSPFRSAGFRWVVVAPAMLAAFVASFLFVTFHLMRATATPKRDKVVAALDAADPGWRMADLFAARNAALPPPERNAAEQVLRAERAIPKSYRDWERQPGSTQWRADLTSPHLPHKADVADLRKHLGQAREAVEQARVVRRLPAGGFTVTPKPDSAFFALPHIDHSRRVWLLLSHDSLVRAYDRDADGAVDSALALLAAARAIGDEPVFVSQLVRMSGANLCVGEVERTLGWCVGFDDAKLAELDQAFAEEAAAPRLRWAMRGERAFHHRMAELVDDGTLPSHQLARYDGQPYWYDPALDLWVRAGARDDQALGLAMFDELVAAADLPAGPQRAKAIGAVEERYGRLGSPAEGPIRRHLLFGLLRPAFHRTTESDTRTVAQLNAARVAIACERHRQKTGTYPETLDELPKELLPEVPTDPFSGKPILYTKLPDGAVAYSVGADGTDDGAVKLNPKNEKGNDLGFRLWTPEHRRKPPSPRPPETPSLFGGPGGFAMPFEDTPKPGTPTAPPPLSPRVRRPPEEPPGR